MSSGGPTLNAAALTADSHAILLLRSALALPSTASAQPLEHGDWSRLAAALKASEWRRPGVLLGKTAAAMARTLDFAIPECERFAALLDRHAALMVELDRLAALGIRALTRVEPGYPERLKHRLGTRAPAALFVAGVLDGIDGATLAVTGSRDLDAAGTAFARALGERCAGAGVTVVSGAARGADREAMNAALAAVGRAVGVLADGLERQVAERATTALLLEGRLALLTPYLPSAGFEAAQAHGRNRLIYCLGDVAVVVASEVNKGGSWSGATEALRERWTPLFVRDAPDTPPGNAALLRRGALPLDPDMLAMEDDPHAALLALAAVAGYGDTAVTEAPPHHDDRQNTAPGELPLAAVSAEPHHAHGAAAAPTTDARSARGTAAGRGRRNGKAPFHPPDSEDEPARSAADQAEPPASAEPADPADGPPLGRLGAPLDAPVEEGPPGAGDGRPVDLFDIAWPLIAAYLQRPYPVRAVAEAFGLEFAQAQRWLRRATEQGLAELVGKASGYRAVTPDRPATVQPALL